MAGRVYVTTEEAGRLLNCPQARQQGCSFVFQPGGRMWLKQGEDGLVISKWALPVLMDWRGAVVLDGMGIQWTL